jgi:Tfp pilus assembly protein PilN
MYKLLIPEERIKIEAEYRSRRVRAALMLATALFIFTIVALSPSLILALGRRNAAVVSLAAAPAEGADNESRELMRWAESQRRALAALAPATTTMPYEYFQKMLGQRPAGARITSLTYTKATNSLSVRGRASDRASLLSFQSALASSGEFAKVDFPVDNLTKEKDIDFQFTLVPKI